MKTDPITYAADAISVNSHIQMPRCILKRFEVKGRFYYYDVEKDIFGSKGHSKSHNTEKGYYSRETEQFLSDEIESSLGVILSGIDKTDRQSTYLPVFPDFDTTIKDYLYSLLSRDPQMIRRVRKESVFFQFASEQSQHDIAVTRGILIAREKGLFKEYTAALAVNRTDIPFVLPIFGICSMGMNGFNCLILPLAPFFAGLLAPNAFFSRFSEALSPYLFIENSSDVRAINRNSARAQLQLGDGSILSSDLVVLEKTLQEARQPAEKNEIG